MSDGKVENMRRKYSLTAKVLHWGFALLFAYGIVKQVDNINQLHNAAFLRFEVIFALIFIAVLGVRFLYMSKTQKTALPENAPEVQKIKARGVHLGMYASLAGIALSGLLMGFVFWLGLTDGFFLEMIVGLHEFFVLSAYGLIGIHVAAAIFHRFKKDGVWDSMTPFWKEKN